MSVISPIASVGVAFLRARRRRLRVVLVAKLLNKVSMPRAARSGLRSRESRETRSAVLAVGDRRALGQRMHSVAAAREDHLYARTFLQAASRRAARCRSRGSASLIPFPLGPPGSVSAVAGSSAMRETPRAELPLRKNRQPAGTPFFAAGGATAIDGSGGGAVFGRFACARGSAASAAARSREARRSPADPAGSGVSHIVR